MSGVAVMERMTMGRSTGPLRSSPTTTSPAKSFSPSDAQPNVIGESVVPVGAMGLLRVRDGSGNSPLRSSSPNTPPRLSSKAPSALTPINTTPQQNLLDSKTNAMQRVLSSTPMARMVGPSDRFSTSVQQPVSMSLDSAAYRGLLQQISNSTITSSYSHNHYLSKFLIPPLSIPTTSGKPAGTSGGPHDAESIFTGGSNRGYVTIVFDLDETLCNNRRAGKAILRPHALELLRHLRALSADPTVNCFVEIILWTASMECVARPVVDRLDPTNTIFNHLIFRDKRWYKETGYTKDLRLLGRDMSHVVIIENSPASVTLNRKHSILVRDFHGGPSDQDLFHVKDILTQWIRAVGEYFQKRGGSTTESLSPSHTTGSSSTSADPICNPVGIVPFLSQNFQSGPNRLLSASNELVSPAGNHSVGGMVGTLQRNSIQGYVPSPVRTSTPPSNHSFGRFVPNTFNRRRN